MKLSGVKNFVAVACLSGGVVIWLAWPTPGQLGTDTCAPNGLEADLSAFIFGTRFWHVQMEDIARRKHTAENWDQRLAAEKSKVEQLLRESKIDATLETAEKRLIDSYRKLPPDEAAEKLEAHKAQQQAERLRSEAATIEQKAAERIMSEKMRKRLPALKRCEAIIRRKLYISLASTPPNIGASDQGVPSRLSNETIDEYIRRTSCGNEPKQAIADPSPQQLPYETIDEYIRRRACGGP